jgi:hypothetical protein
MRRLGNSPNIFFPIAAAVTSMWRVTSAGYY